MIVDLDDAAFGGERDHVVGHIARGIADGAAGGVRGDQRGFADFEGVVESFVGDVRDVHQDAKAIHFEDDLLAEIGEAVVCGLIGGGIGPLGVVPCA